MVQQRRVGVYVNGRADLGCDVGAIACRDQVDWQALSEVVADAWVEERRFSTLEDRLRHEDDLDRLLSDWTRKRDPFDSASALRAAGVPASAVQKPEDRIDKDPSTEAWGLWPTVTHSAMGEVRADGLPVHLSQTDWEIRRGAPCLGEHNDRVFGEVLGLSEREIAELRREGVI